MIGQKVGFDKIQGFEYMVFTKHVHPRFQCLGTYKITQQQVEAKLTTLVTAYIAALENDERPALKNQYCW